MKKFKPYRCHQCIYFRENENSESIQGLHDCCRFPPNSNNEYSKVMTYDYCGEGISIKKPKLME